MSCAHGKPAHPACFNTLAYHLGHKHVGKLCRMCLQQTRPLPRRQKTKYQPGTLRLTAAQQELDASAPKLLVVLNAHAHARIPHSQNKGWATEQSPHGVNAEHGEVERKLLKLARFAERADRRHVRQPSTAQHHHRPAREVGPVCKGLDKGVAHNVLARMQEARIAARVARTDARACPHQRRDTVRQLLDIHVASNGQPARPHAHFLLRHTEHIWAEKVRMGKDPRVESAAGHAGNHDVRSPTCPKMQRAGKIRHLVALETREVVNQQQRPCFLTLVCVFLARVDSTRPGNRKPAKMQPDGARGAMRIARGNPYGRWFVAVAALDACGILGPRGCAGAIDRTLPLTCIEASTAHKSPLQFAVTARHVGHHLRRCKVNVHHRTGMRLQGTRRVLAQQRRLAIPPRGPQHDDALSAQSVVYLIQELRPRHKRALGRPEGSILPCIAQLRLRLHCEQGHKNMPFPGTLKKTVTFAHAGL